MSIKADDTNFKAPSPLGERAGVRRDLLSSINSPADLRLLDEKQLPQLCDELRSFIINSLSSNPGHFASSLGCIELAVALHYVYNTPDDRLVWDVGHQAYAHKILTGRRDSFATNRKFGGLHPFPCPQESEYDTFTCGHASNSISAALGMAVAAQRLGRGDRRVVAIIGDGAMSGGLAFEGLNNLSACQNDLLVILNDNNMSIDNSVGGMKTYLHKLQTSGTYNKMRYAVSRWGWMTDKRRKALLRFNNSLKSLITKRQNVWEGMDIRYFGIVDGHDVLELVRTLRVIKDMHGPKMLHINTQKGHGYQPAVEDPTLWHAPGCFDPETGKRDEHKNSAALPKFQDVFGETLLELAKANPRIVGVTPAMPTGCSMSIMAREMPDRVFDVGIAEGHAVTFSGGMAKDGLLPFCNIYSAFAQRAYDNIIHDVCIEGLNVVFCFDRAGIVGEDGATHHGAFDLAALRPIPGVTICSPMNGDELRDMMYTAQLPGKGPFVIRYPRGACEEKPSGKPMQELEIGKAVLLRQSADNGQSDDRPQLWVLSLGPIGYEAGRALDKAEGVRWQHYDMRFLKPLDTDLLDRIGKSGGSIVTVEDGVANGGLGSAVAEYMAERGYDVTIRRIGMPDSFVPHGSVKELRRLCGMDAEGIAGILTPALSLKGEGA